MTRWTHHEWKNHENTCAAGLLPTWSCTLETYAGGVHSQSVFFDNELEARVRQVNHPGTYLEVWDPTATHWRPVKEG